MHQTGNMMLPLTRNARFTAAALVLALGLSPLSSVAQTNGAKPKAAQSATVAPEAAKPAPYDIQLARLSEILGALEYIEGLCKNATPNDWRSDMSQLLQAEAANEPLRHERLTAAYNRGYRSFASVYTDCTSNAKLAEKAYRNEGATLSQEITSRFGN
jgi:uncharacterized protein (TIGR02301 family)